MTLPPLHSFKVFESVARLGSLAAAAVELHVTVGAVSQQVKALQASLGVELFEKRGRQLVLTTNGRQLQKRVANAMGEISDAVDALRSGARMNRYRSKSPYPFPRPKVWTGLPRHCCASWKPPARCG